MNFGCSFSQDNFLNIFTTYLDKIGKEEGKARNVTLNFCGDCNGWAFLYAYYANTHREKEFKDILDYINHWDGNISSLKSNYGLSDDLRKSYHNGIELFEHTINNVVWFAQTNSGHIMPHLTQLDRVEQWKVVQNPNFELKEIFSLPTQWTYACSKTNLPDVLSICAHWTDTWLDIGVYSNLGGHALSVYITPEGNFKFYDCNNDFLPIESASTYSVCNNIFDALGPNAYVGDFFMYKFIPTANNDDVIQPNYNQLSTSIKYQTVSEILRGALDTSQVDLFYSVFKMDDNHAKKIVADFGKEALNKAAAEEHIDLVKLMLSAGVNVNSVYDFDTPLIRASESGNMEIVSLLLENHANVNGKGSYGSTALMVATQNGYIDIVKKLLYCGADALIKNKIGLTAKDYAKNLEIWDLLNKAELHKLSSDDLSSDFSAMYLHEQDVDHAAPIKVSDCFTTTDHLLPSLQAVQILPHRPELPILSVEI